LLKNEKKHGVNTIYFIFCAGVLWCVLYNSQHELLTATRDLPIVHIVYWR